MYSIDFRHSCAPTLCVLDSQSLSMCVRLCVWVIFVFFWHNVELIGSWFFALALALWPQNVHIMCIPLNLMETHIEQYYLLGIDFKLEVNLFVIFTVNTRWLESRTSTASCANYVNAYYILCNGFGGGGNTENGEEFSVRGKQRWNNQD